MEESFLIQKMRDGDLVSFKEWMTIYSRNIERFSIQFGCTREQAGEVAEATFRTLYTNLEKLNDDESLVIILYKIALNELTSIHHLDLIQETIFQFEEDQELHEKIIRLEPNTKAPFILSQFHGMNDSDIASIVGTSEVAVSTSITQAYQELSEYVDGSRMEKRLKFLHKSYGRLNSSFRKEHVFEEPKKVEQITSKTPQRITKKAIITWIAGILVLLGLVAVPVVTGEEYQRASAERYVEKLKQSFEKEMASRFTTLGITETTEKDRDEFYMINYGRVARDEFETMTRRLDRYIAGNVAIDKKQFSEQYDKILKTVELPSEKAKRLFNNPLNNDQEKSEEFLIDYMNQNFEIQQAYYSILYKHERIIQEAIVDETVDVEKFLEKKGTYPEDLQKAIVGMEKQNIYLISSEWATLFPVFGKNEFSAKIRSSIHKDLVGYITAMESGPLIHNLKNETSLNEAIDALVEMEQTMFTSGENNNHYFMLSYNYSALLNAIVVGTEPNQFIGNDGKVKEEIRAGWRRIASIGKDSPSAYIVNLVIDEMEANGWTESESYRRLNEHHFQQAMTLAKNGDLDSFSIYGIIQLENGPSFVEFPDTHYENLVEETYHLFAPEYDFTVLKDVHPLVIIGVYFYANDREDPKTMWHLTNRMHNVQTLEEYMSEWSKTDFELHKIDSLYFSGGWSNGSIDFQSGNVFFQSVAMTADEDDVWKIKYININRGY